MEMDELVNYNWITMWKKLYESAELRKQMRRGCLGKNSALHLDLSKGGL